MRHLTSLSLWLLIAALLIGCGPRVKPISLHDSSIPADSRRFVADTEDAVSIARVARDEAARELREVRDWRRDVVRGVEWPAPAASAIERLEMVADQRVVLAEMELEQANAALELAQAKYDLVTAETAIRHDIARYDLEPLRARTDTARDKMRSLTESILLKRDEIDELTTRWWAAYASWADKGDTRLYYVPFIDVEASKAPAKKRKKPREDEPEEPKKDGEPAGAEKEEEPSDEGGDLRIW